MGNRSYLMVQIKQPDQQIQDTVLFEGNNTLALFWLTLLSPKEIERIRPLYHQTYDPEQEEDIDCLMVTEQQASIKRAKSFRPSIQKNFPAASDLFDSWLDFLANVNTNDGCFYIDLINLLGFYTDPDEFIDELKDIQTDFGKYLKNANHHIGELTGWLNWDDKEDLAAFMPVYQQWEKPKRTTQNADQIQQQTKSKISNNTTFILVGCSIVILLLLFLKSQS